MEEQRWKFVSDPTTRVSCYICEHMDGVSPEEPIRFTLLHSPILSLILSFQFPRSFSLQRVLDLFLLGVSSNHDISTMNPQGLWMNDLPCDSSLTLGDICKDQTGLALVVKDAPVPIIVTCRCSLGSKRLPMFDYQTVQLALEAFVKVDNEM